MSRRRDTLEKKIQRDIEADLGAEPDLLLLRNSVGEAVYFDDDGREFHVPYGLGKGSPDLVGILSVSQQLLASQPHRVENRVTLGIWVAFEVKAPEGVVDPEQEACHRAWRRFGALVYVVRSVAEARNALARARRFEQ